MKFTMFFLFISRDFAATGLYTLTADTFKMSETTTIIAYTDRPLQEAEYGMSLGQVTIDRLIGQGGQAAVYSGRWVGVPVAVKVPRHLRKNHALRKEASFLSRLRHPSVCALYGHTLLPDGSSALLLELLPSTLASLLEQPQPLPACLAGRIASEVAAGIGFLHRNNVMHRDIKPSNVLLDGSAHAKAPEVRSSSSLVQRSAYNEQCDVYSYGMLLWPLMADVAADALRLAASVNALGSAAANAVFICPAAAPEEAAMREGARETGAGEAPRLRRRAAQPQYHTGHVHRGAGVGQ
ncbi:hypothetical protein EMIHUDRAFT_118114 [Emiliania huxleyi CCMP1516]|uniref:Protein kinase domain-containing protein n=2 Tax=Emiliania huxleyi TaxID=2903 RepID=A0A0D3J6P4_EMIH1|nr:hypothetical protein EMIHUDRAFT_118114 [Emiliania huxleyi CCMP1516]EOD19179.1 hypothetical protein EMIHUDRAFT_118114 [Emiliania huxleyi CCMP1516]|eukprot:XP_005771608.1 hypothetical protein EMIHUDRAFT_118114 [Emiliania huxleyi CCMP1516]